MKRSILFVLALGCLLPVRVHAADTAAGKALFDQRCVMCHGPLGAGDGQLAATLPPETKPRNLQEGKFKFVTDDASIKKLLQGGGSAVGLSPLMPPQPDLKDDQIDNLIAYVRSLKK
jgi:mono/diheme cytochrome c family protein